MYRINNMLVGRAIGAVRRWLQNQGVIILTLLGCLSFPVELLAHQGEERAPESSILVDTAWLADNRENSDVVIIDTREAVEYQGVESTASRSGHIPTAGSIPKNNNLEVRNGIFYIKSLSSLEDLYQGVDEFSRVILYCNGVRESSITYMALRLLGRKVSVYDGGWREWGNNPGLPIVTSVQ